MFIMAAAIFFGQFYIFKKYFYNVFEMQVFLLKLHINLFGLFLWFLQLLVTIYSCSFPHGCFDYYNETASSPSPPQPFIQRGGHR